jgi:hypothetical protein
MVGSAMSHESQYLRWESFHDFEDGPIDVRPRLEDASGVPNLLVHFPSSSREDKPQAHRPISQLARLSEPHHFDHLGWPQVGGDSGVPSSLS